MVEASLIYPFIILSVTATIMILTFLLVEGMAQIHVHNCLRYEAGKLTETFNGQSTKDGAENVAFSKSFGGFHTELHGRQSVELDGAGLLPRQFTKNINGRIFLIDEQKYIRYMDLFLQEAQE